MNPRQRRGVLFIVLAILGMVGVFAAISSYVSDVRSEVDPKVTVLMLTEPVQADREVTPDMVEEVEVPERYASETSLVDVGSAQGRVSTANLEPGTYLQEGMLELAPDAGRNEREISILIDAETGVAGRIEPGNFVDIVATFEQTDQAVTQSRFQIQQARVVAIGIAEQVQQEGSGGTLQTASVVPITFALDPDDALKVAYAESFATEVRLALLPIADAKRVPEDEEAFGIGPDGATLFGDTPEE